MQAQSFNVLQLLRLPSTSAFCFYSTWYPYKFAVLPSLAPRCFGLHGRLTGWQNSSD